MLKRTFQALLFLALVPLAGACVPAHPKHAVRLSLPRGPLPERSAAMDLGPRRRCYRLARLTWNGWGVFAGRLRVSQEALRALLEHAGAADLARALPAARPKFRRMEAGPPETEAAREATVAADAAAQSWGSRIVCRMGTGMEVTPTPGLDAAKVGSLAAYRATESLLLGIRSDLGYRPSLEDVLDAYNQRLAFALGLDASDARRVSCMPGRRGPLIMGPLFAW